MIVNGKDFWETWLISQDIESARLILMLGYRSSVKVHHTRQDFFLDNNTEVLIASKKKEKEKWVAMSEENANLEIKSGPFLTLRTPSEMEVAPRYTLFSLFFWRDFGHVSILLSFGLFFQFSLVIKGKYVIHICSKWRKTNIPIIISKKFLESVLWLCLESTPTICIFNF